MANYGIQFKDKAGNNFYPCPFPIGSIYLSVIDINPSNYWGGTWVKVSGGFLYGCINSVEDVLATSSGHLTKPSTGSTGGSSASSTGSHKLTGAQSGMPAHTHALGNANGNSPYSQWVSTSAKGWVGNIATSSAGPLDASEGHSHTMTHTHSLNSHRHEMNYIGVWVFKRTA